MDTSQSNCPVSDDAYNGIIQCVITNLFSFNTTKQEKVLKHYYHEDALYMSPVLSTKGIDNIRRVLLVWKALNGKEPNITNICFDGQRTCTVFLTQIVCPRGIPATLFGMALPVVVTLSFEDVEGHPDLMKVARHEEHWTAQGVVDALLPMVARDWYDRLVRVTLGQMLAAAGHVLRSANETALLLSTRAREIEDGVRRLDEQRITAHDACHHDSESSVTDVDVVAVRPSKT